MKVVPGMNHLRRCLLFLCLYAISLVSLGLPLQAKDLAAYKIGDVADADITTPVPMDVVDRAATEALQMSRAREYPSIFRSWPDATNVMSDSFLTAFATSHSNFMAELDGDYHSQKLSDATISSSDFDTLVTAFGVEHRNFPISEKLAAEWARGGTGEATRDQLLDALQKVASQRICPDTMPKGMVVGKMIRLVTVTNLDDKLTYERVQAGELASADTLMTVSNARSLFRLGFLPVNQLFARALSDLIQPNCFPDLPFTQLTRGTAVYQLVVSDHYDAGDVIVQQGGKIDAKIKAALDALEGKLKSKPQVATNAPAAPISIAPPAKSPEKSPEPQPTSKTARATAAMPPKKTATTNAAAPTVRTASHSAVKHKPTVKSSATLDGLITLLVGTSATALFVAIWQLVRQRKSGQSAEAEVQAPLPLKDPEKENLTPQVAHAVREAVQQELAMQRRELLVAQQAATDEIVALVKRLDDLQVPMQERLQTYESRIQTLEKELAMRNEENRELLKLKIEMISKQLETERAASLKPPRPDSAVNAPSLSA